MRTRVLVGILAVTTGSVPALAYAVQVPPSIEIEAGPAASIPITTGSVSLFGITATGAPLIGTANQPVLRVDGSLSSNVFDPLPVEVTEFNLVTSGAQASFAAAIAGTLPLGDTVSWNAYFDPSNTPFGTADLIGSGTFADSSTELPIGFSDSKTVTGSLTGPFALTEILSIEAPNGTALTFNSSITASLAPIPEPGSLALVGFGLLGLGLIAPVRHWLSARL